jgi:protein-S-isoprenylcysteine O-methyltransferase Ste14
MTPAQAMAGLWLGWLGSWMAAALIWRGPRQQRASAAGWSMLLPAAGFALLFFDIRGDFAAALRLWSTNAAAAWICVTLAAAGLALMWWARLTMGRLWSGGIETREGHRVIESGPFAHMRHPIYSGLILMAGAKAAMIGTLAALAGAGVLAAGFILKARAEERFLIAAFGDSYRAYRRRVPMLVPRIRHGRASG